MSEDRSNGEEGRTSWLEKIALRLSTGPKSRRSLRDHIAAAHDNEVIDDEAQGIIEGAMRVADMQVRHIMVPRPQMEVIRADAGLEEILHQVAESVHSRYPVMGDNAGEVLGILLAKDLLPLLLNPGEEPADVTPLMRPVVLVPESKRLNVLLREFRNSRNHMAIVIDEYGGVAGLVTIEDVLEEIVGEIEDETDLEADQFISKIGDAEYLVKALTPIDDFNREFDCDFSDDEFETIGGLVMQQFGYLPSRNEKIELEGFEFQVINSDRRKIHSVRVHVGNR
ncbi:MAG: CBS domain-containing protein [Halieaceae bacterium]|nr:CBS domain-containing protein [Halieaceae bacterium]